jgi:hypothetical protein
MLLLERVKKWEIPNTSSFGSWPWDEETLGAIAPRIAHDSGPHGCKGGVDRSIQVLKFT